MLNNQLTNKEAELLAFIKDCLADGGVWPTQKEMCEAMGWAGKGNANYYLSRLAAKGLVQNTRWGAWSLINTPNASNDNSMIELAREAMKLPGAPDVLMYMTEAGKGFVWTTASETEHSEEWVWDLSADTEAGWALGGVLLGALGPNRVFIENSSGQEDGVAGYRIRAGLWIGCDTLSEACCRVAVDRGYWAGGMTTTEIAQLAIGLGPWPVGGAE